MMQMGNKTEPKLKPPNSNPKHFLTNSRPPLPIL